MNRDSSAAVQFRVLFALLMREMTTRYGRRAGGYVWAVLEPVGTVAILTFIFSAIARHPPLGQSFAMFFGVGYMVFHFYADISRGVSAAVSSNKALLAFPRVTILDAILARLILHLVTTLFVSSTVLIALAWATGEPLSVDLKAIFTAIALSAAIGFAVGLLNCSLFIYSPTWQTTFGIINRPLFLISGIFFLYENLPSSVQYLAWWNPLIHVTSIMRAGFYANYDATFSSPIYVVIFICLVLFIGVLTLRALRARMLES